MQLPLRYLYCYRYRCRYRCATAAAASGCCNLYHCLEIALVSATPKTASDVGFLPHIQAQTAPTSSFCNNTICIESTAQEKEGESETEKEEDS